MFSKHIIEACFRGMVSVACEQIGVSVLSSDEFILDADKLGLLESEVILGSETATFIQSEDGRGMQFLGGSGKAAAEPFLKRLSQSLHHLLYLPGQIEGRAREFLALKLSLGRGATAE